jgi:hypothetical protein
MASRARRDRHAVRCIAAMCAAALVASVNACGKAESARADSVAAVQKTIQSVASDARAATSPCPRTGHWSACQVRYRIDRAGQAPHDTTADASLPALGPKPNAYRLGKSVLAVYLFADSSARARAGRSLDTTTFVPYTRDLTVLSRATVIENDNALALLFSKNDHQRERVSDALTAGPPQP